MPATLAFDPCDFLPLSLVDTHCHLYSLVKKDVAFLPLYQSLYEQKFLKEIWDIGLEAQDYPERKELLASFPWVRFAIGLHPNSAHEQCINQDEFLVWGKEKQVILIGETGLDFYRSSEFKKEQYENFIKHIELANILSKPIIAHVRAAERDFLQIIRAHKVKAGGIWHCFSADYELARQAVDLGFKISFAGNLTYKKNQLLQECVQKLNLESLLIETDAPYLSPVPLRGKINHSANLRYTLSFLAELRKLSIEELAQQLKKNAYQLIGKI